MTGTKRKKIILLLSCLIGTFLFGTASYHYIEGINIFDSFYMTLITISTVGFAELYPLSKSGRIITMVIISAGITIVAYSAGSLLKILIEGELTKTLGRKKLNKKISSLNNHYIICGYGRIGSLIAKELKENKIKFVIIDSNPDKIDHFENDGMLYIIGDATSEDTLETARIMKSKGLVTAVKTDADNVFITLTARSLNPNLYILSRASEELNSQKLIRAGASKVVLPYMIGGKRMAHALLKPTVVDFIDSTMVNSELGLSMEEILIHEKSELNGKNLIESNLRKNFGIIIVAIKKHAKEMIFNPMPYEVIEKGDVLVILGKREDLAKLRKAT